MLRALMGTARRAFRFNERWRSWRLLRGEPLELVARETNVSIARLTEWRDRAFAGSLGGVEARVESFKLTTSAL